MQIRTVGSNGQISLGTKRAGQAVPIDEVGPEVLNWEQVVSDRCLHLDEIQSGRGPRGEILWPVHVSEKFRAVVVRDADFMRCLSLHPDRDGACRPQSGGSATADLIFENARLARIYDALDTAEREDLDPYVTMAEGWSAWRVIDVGCGTGVLASRLAQKGFDVTGVDPALASLEVAKAKPYADRVTWIHGTAEDLPPVAADVAFMTGNVAPVFLSDRDWYGTLIACRRSLAEGGRLAFETRDPARQAWAKWIPEFTERIVDIPGVGRVETWTDLLDVSLPFVRFRHSYRFRARGTTLASESTLRFRSRAEVAASLEEAGFVIEEVRDAPDRPGLEFVFVALKSG